MTIINNHSERYAIIGSSTSGKSYFLCHEIVPHYRYIHYFGPKHNIEGIKECMAENALFMAYSQIISLSDIYNKAKKLTNEGKQLPPQLIIFDDFIDTKFIKTDIAKILFAEGRHFNLSIAMIAHTPNLVITPFIKANLTSIVLCEYFANGAYNELIEEYFMPLLSDEIDDYSDKKELKRRLNVALKEAFKYKYSKLIIRPQERTWDIYLPETLIEKSPSFQSGPICNIPTVRTTKDLVNELTEHHPDYKKEETWLSRFKSWIY